MSNLVESPVSSTPIPPEPSPFDKLPPPANIEQRIPIAAVKAANRLKNTKIGEGRTCRRVSDTIRKFLNSRHPAALDEQGRTRFVRMLDNMARIASSKSPLAVAAFTALMDRGWGKAKSSDEDLDAIAKQGGIQIVYVAPTELEDVKKVVPALAPKPEFIDAEVVDEQR